MLNVYVRLCVCMCVCVCVCVDEDPHPYVSAKTYVRLSFTSARPLNPVPKEPRVVHNVDLVAFFSYLSYALSLSHLCNLFCSFFVCRSVRDVIKARPRIPRHLQPRGARG